MTDNFSDNNRNQINVAIVGAVSAGKSTLLNTIFAETYSHCKIKRTTMTPQIYYEYDRKDATQSSTKIKQKNKEINDRLIQKTEKQEPINIDDIVENKYIVPKIHNFTKLVKNVYLTIYDIPGLNDARTKDLYFQYLQNNFYKFDIILFVVDINSALNTSDEIEILTKIISNCKTNNDKYGIHNKLIIIPNKCDDMSLDDHNNLILEEELTEMLDQIKTQVRQKIKEIYPSLEYNITPLSSEDSYIYRILARNPNTELDMKYLNKFGYMEYGRTRWNKLSEEKKKQQIKKLMRDWDMESTLTITGFNGFSKVLNKYLIPVNQKTFINNHIIYSIQSIKDNHKVDISDDVQMFYSYYLRYKELQKMISSGIDCISEFSRYLTKYLEAYKQKVLVGFIEYTKNSEYSNAVKRNSKSNVSEFHTKIKQESFVPQVEESKKILDNMVRLFNGDVPIIAEYANDVTSALSNYYTEQIDSKIKPVKFIFDFLKKLLTFNRRPTTDNINNFLDNPDMYNNSPSSIVTYLNMLESQSLIDYEEKMDKILDILNNVYQKFASKTNKPGENYISSDNHLSYFYFAEKFWNKFVLLNLDYNPLIEELAFRSKYNFSLEISNCHGTGKFPSGNVYFKNDEDSILILEKYYLELYLKKIGGKRPSKSVKFRIRSKSDVKQPNTCGNISDELDAELGLA